MNVGVQIPLRDTYFISFSYILRSGLLWKLRFKEWSWIYICLIKILTLLGKYVHLEWLKVTNAIVEDIVEVQNLIFIWLIGVNTMCNSKVGLEKWIQQERSSPTCSLRRYFQVYRWVDTSGDCRISLTWSWYYHQIVVLPHTTPANLLALLYKPWTIMRISAKHQLHFL